MVRLHIKKGDESQFLYETTVSVPVDELIPDLVAIYNGRLKVYRLCAEMETLADHGITLPPNMQGLTDEQVEELKLVDECAAKCVPSGGPIECPDKIGRRNGKAPNAHMKEVLLKSVKEAKDMVTKKLVEMNQTLTLRVVGEAAAQLGGAVTIVYPMGLPPHDPIRQELENEEDLEGTQASKEVIPPGEGALWWASKEIMRGKILSDFVGKNDKTKIVAKLQKRGQGPPGREAVVSEKEQKEMMAFYYRKQEEMKKMDKEADDAHLNSDWSDSQSLKRQFQGLSDIKWGSK